VVRKLPNLKIIEKYGCSINIH